MMSNTSNIDDVSGSNSLPSGLQLLLRKRFIAADEQSRLSTRERGFKTHAKDLYKFLKQSNVSIQSVEGLLRGKRVHKDIEEGEAESKTELESSTIPESRHLEIMQHKMKFLNENLLMKLLPEAISPIYLISKEHGVCIDHAIYTLQEETSYMQTKMTELMKVVQQLETERDYFANETASLAKVVKLLCQEKLERNESKRRKRRRRRRKGERKKTTSNDTRSTLMMNGKDLIKLAKEDDDESVVSSVTSSDNDDSYSYDDYSDIDEESSNGTDDYGYDNNNDNSNNNNSNNNNNNNNNNNSGGSETSMVSNTLGVGDNQFDLKRNDDKETLMIPQAEGLLSETSSQNSSKKSLLLKESHLDKAKRVTENTDQLIKNFMKSADEIAARATQREIAEKENERMQMELRTKKARELFLSQGHTVKLNKSRKDHENRNQKNDKKRMKSTKQRREEARLKKLHAKWDAENNVSNKFHSDTGIDDRDEAALAVKMLEGQIDKLNAQLEVAKVHAMTPQQRREKEENDARELEEARKRVTDAKAVNFAKFKITSMLKTYVKRFRKNRNKRQNAAKRIQAWARFYSFWSRVRFRVRTKHLAQFLAGICFKLFIKKKRKRLAAAKYIQRFVRGRRYRWIMRKTFRGILLAAHTKAAITVKNRVDPIMNKINDLTSFILSIAPQSVADTIAFKLATRKMEESSSLKKPDMSAKELLSGKYDKPLWQVVDELWKTAKTMSRKFNLFEKQRESQSIAANSALRLHYLTSELERIDQRTEVLYHYGLSSDTSNIEQSDSSQQHDDRERIQLKKAIEQKRARAYSKPMKGMSGPESNKNNDDINENAIQQSDVPIIKMGAIRIPTVPSMPITMEERKEVVEFPPTSTSNIRAVEIYGSDLFMGNQKGVKDMYGENEFGDERIPAGGLLYERMLSFGKRCDKEVLLAKIVTLKKRAEEFSKSASKKESLLTKKDEVSKFVMNRYSSKKPLLERTKPALSTTPSADINTSSTKKGSSVLFGDVLLQDSNTTVPLPARDTGNSLVGCPELEAINRVIFTKVPQLAKKYGCYPMMAINSSTGQSLAVPSLGYTPDLTAPLASDVLNFHLLLNTGCKPVTYRIGVSNSVKYTKGDMHTPQRPIIPPRASFDHILEVSLMNGNVTKADNAKNRGEGRGWDKKSHHLNELCLSGSLTVPVSVQDQQHFSNRITNSSWPVLDTPALVPPMSQWLLYGIKNYCDHSIVHVDDKKKKDNTALKKDRNTALDINGVSEGNEKNEENEDSLKVSTSTAIRPSEFQKLMEEIVNHFNVGLLSLYRENAGSVPLSPCLQVFALCGFLFSTSTSNHKQDKDFPEKVDLDTWLINCEGRLTNPQGHSKLAEVLEPSRDTGAIVVFIGYLLELCAIVHTKSIDEWMSLTPSMTPFSARFHPNGNESGKKDNDQMEHSIPLTISVAEALLVLQFAYGLSATDVHAPEDLLRHLSNKAYAKTSVWYKDTEFSNAVQDVLALAGVGIKSIIKSQSLGCMDATTGKESHPPTSSSISAEGYFARPIVPPPSKKRQHRHTNTVGSLMGDLKQEAALSHRFRVPNVIPVLDLKQNSLDKIRDLLDMQSVNQTDSLDGKNVKGMKKDEEGRDDMEIALMGLEARRKIFYNAKDFEVKRGGILLPSRKKAKQIYQYQYKDTRRVTDEYGDVYEFNVKDYEKVLQDLDFSYDYEMWPTGDDDKDIDKTEDIEVKSEGKHLAIMDPQSYAKQYSAINGLNVILDLPHHSASTRKERSNNDTEGSSWFKSYKSDAIMMHTENKNTEKTNQKSVEDLLADEQARISEEEMHMTLFEVNQRRSKLSSMKKSKKRGPQKKTNTPGTASSSDNNNTDLELKDETSSDTKKDRSSDTITLTIKPGDLVPNDTAYLSEATIDPFALCMVLLRFHLQQKRRVEHMVWLNAIWREIDDENIGAIAKEKWMDVVHHHIFHSRFDFEWDISKSSDDHIWNAWEVAVSNPLVVDNGIMDFKAFVRAVELLIGNEDKNMEN